MPFVGNDKYNREYNSNLRARESVRANKSALSKLNKTCNKKVKADHEESIDLKYENKKASYAEVLTNKS